MKNLKAKKKTVRTAFGAIDLGDICLQAITCKTIRLDDGDILGIVALLKVECRGSVNIFSVLCSIFLHRCILIKSQIYFVLQPHAIIGPTLK